jgi:PAS domain S-box-containing protein
MQELSDYENRLNDLKDKNNLAKLVTELEKANAELLESQRAAPGLIEDALLSKEALRTNESRMRKQKEAFQAAINGASLADSLKIITSLVQDEMAPNTRTAFYISDAGGKFLHPVWGAASMSDGYLQKINGFLIGKDSLACGLAISLGKPVLTADVLNEPLWKPWIYLAKEFNFRGCWSFPVKTGENKPVGTFALYFEEPHEANQKDVSLAEIIAQTAAVLISNNIDTQKREQAEEALRKSEAKYRTIFDTTNDGFAIIEMIFDETGKAVDFIYREANPALILQTGVNLAGKSSKEVFPDMHQSILDAYGNVAKNGISVQQEYSIQALGQWFQTTASRISEGNKNLVSVISRNITGRKRLEQQQEFRLKLSDAIRHLSDPKKIEEEVTRIAMDHFSANRCYFCVINGENLIISHEAATEGLPSVAGTYLLSSFPLFKKVIDSGSVFVINDAKTSKVIDEDLRALCLQLKVISFIDVPVIKNGKAIGILCLVQSTPRNWSDEEIELANETAERVWSTMERAKAEEALHQSEARLKTTMDSATDYAMIRFHNFITFSGSFTVCNTESGIEMMISFDASSPHGALLFLS